MTIEKQNRLTFILDGISDFANVDTERNEITITKKRFLALENWEFTMIRTLMVEHEYDFTITK